MKNLISGFVAIMTIVFLANASFAQQQPGSNTVFIASDVKPHYLTDDSISLSGKVPSINVGQIVYILYGYCNAPIYYKVTSIKQEGDKTILGIIFPTQEEYLKTIDELNHDPASKSAMQKYQEELKSGKFGPTFTPGVPGATVTNSSGAPLPQTDPECKAALDRAAKKHP